jgi:two-component system, OmpR family, sensor kinase
MTVKDNGSGIPASAQKRIFERFFRAGKDQFRSTPQGSGAGLGLSIARWIAETHHGRLELLRSDGSGSTFGAFFPQQTGL